MSPIILLWTGRVSLNRVLDYDTMNSKQLTFQIEAYTRGPNVRKAMATVIVNVQDINDNVPKFLQGVSVEGNQGSQFKQATVDITCCEEVRRRLYKFFLSYISIKIVAIWIIRSPSGCNE